VQLAVRLGVALDRLDVGAVSLDGEDGARLDGRAVEQDRARPTLRRVATNMGPGQTQLLAQEVHQELTRLNVPAVLPAVYRDADRVQAWFRDCLCLDHLLLFRLTVYELGLVYGSRDPGVGALLEALVCRAESGVGSQGSVCAPTPPPIRQHLAIVPK